MTRIRYVALSLAAAVLGLAWLLSAAPATAQFSSHPAGYHLAPIDISDTSDVSGLSWSGNTLMLDDFSDSGGNWVALATYTGTEQIVGIAARITDMTYSDPSSQFFEMIPDSSWGTSYTRTPVYSYDLDPDFWWFHSYSQTARASVSSWITDDLGSPYKDPTDLFSSNFSQPLGGFWFKKNRGYITSASIDIYLILAGNPPAPEPPPPDIHGGGYCSFPITITETITQDDGTVITTTETTTHTVQANLLDNTSFEKRAGAGPASWQTVVNGVVQDVGGIWWASGHGNTGDYAISGIADYQAYQSTGLYSAGDYRIGAYAKCTGSGCGVAQMRWDGTVIAAGLALSSTYQVFSGTYTSGGGGSAITVDMPPDPNVWVDDVFVYPIDANGDLLCDPAYYPPPDEEPGGGSAPPPDCVVDPTTNACIWAPPGGAGTTCYYCAQPGASNMFAVSLWIGWLGCLLRNMFSCSLRVWLFDLSNSLLAVMATLSMTINWLNSSVQAAIDSNVARGGRLAAWAVSFWLEWAAYLAQTPQQITIIISTVIETAESGADWAAIVWEIIQILFGLLGFLIRLIFGAVAGVLSLLIDIIRQLRLAATAPAFTLEEFTGGDNGAGAGSPAQGITIFLLAMATMDTAIADYGLWPIIYTVLGIVGIVIVLWIIRQWRDDILPI